MAAGHDHLGGCSWPAAMGAADATPWPTGPPRRPRHPPPCHGPPHRSGTPPRGSTGWPHDRPHGVSANVLYGCGHIIMQSHDLHSSQLNTTPGRPRRLAVPLPSRGHAQRRVITPRFPTPQRCRWASDPDTQPPSLAGEVKQPRDVQGHLGAWRDELPVREVCTMIRPHPYRQSADTPVVVVVLSHP
jgi:hypothetical protein